MLAAHYPADKDVWQGWQAMEQAQSLLLYTTIVQRQHVQAAG